MVGKEWEGQPLQETNGYPLTHDILAALGLLESRQDGSGETETFEEDCSKLQSRFASNGPANRRGSLSSDSDHSQHGSLQQRLRQRKTSPVPIQPQSFNDKFSFQSASSTSLPSPAPQKRKSFPPAQPSPLHTNTTPLTSNDPTFYQAEWAQAIHPANQQPQEIMRSCWAMQQPPHPQQPQPQQTHQQLPDTFAPQMQAQHMNPDYFNQQSQPQAPPVQLDQWQSSTYAFDTNDHGLGEAVGFHPHQQSQQQQSLAAAMAAPGLDFNMVDPMDVDFAKFIEVQVHT